MKFDQLTAIEKQLEAMKGLDALYRRIASEDLSMDFDIDLSGVPDDVWNKAERAARSVLLDGVREQFERGVKELEAAGVTDIPSIGNWPQEEKKPRHGFG